MDKKNKNIIFWIAGIALVLLVVSQLPLAPWFAIISKTTCAEKTLSYFDMDGNVLDSQRINDGVNNGAVFVPGRLGQSIEFNTTTYVNFPVISSENKTIIMWIKNYSNVGSGWYFASETNGVSGTNGIIPLDSQFGLNLNGSVDEIVIFSPALTSLELSNFSTGVKACYTVSYEENVSCKDVATEQVTDPGYGCLNYSGDFFPNCEYEWIDASQYKIENNLCGRYFYCQNPCLTTGNCYVSNQDCTENLVYDCYVIESDQCIHKTNYANCTGTDYYTNITACQEDSPEPTLTTPAGTTTPLSTSIKDKLMQEVFEIAGFKVTLVHLLILLILVIAVLYFVGSKK